MCGIAGIVPLNGGTPADGSQLGAMCATIVHRGPDDEGCDIRDGVRHRACGGSRSSTSPADTSRSTTKTAPSGSSSTARSTTYRELRAELEAAGHRFATASDTEVLVHLWEEHGPDSPPVSTGCSRWRCTTASAAGSCWSATTSASSRSTTRYSPAPGLRLRDQGDPRFGPHLPYARSRRPGQFLAWEYVPAPPRSSRK